MPKKKLRGANNYTIGLDIGTNSVGWCATDSYTGELLYFKSKPAWGSILFSEGQTAKERRTSRGMRRRYDRRRQRLDLLQGFFQDEIEELDSDFFNRMKHSHLIQHDDGCGHGVPLFGETKLFNGEEWNDKKYFEKYPTIYHLRKELVESDEQADIRLVYLALHHIVKYRGNFLRQDEKLSAKSASPEKAIRDFIEAYRLYVQNHMISIEELELDSDDVSGFASSDQQIDIFIKEFMEKLNDKTLSRQQHKEETYKLFQSFWKDIDIKAHENIVTKQLEAISKFIFGSQGELANLLVCNATKDSKVSFEDSNIEDELEPFMVDDASHEFLTALQSLYSAITLNSILGETSNGTVSNAMVARYDKYGKQLSTLKKLVKKYAPDKYAEAFSGQKYDEAYLKKKDNIERQNSFKRVFGQYDPEKAKGYTAYHFSHDQEQVFEYFFKKKETKDKAIGILNNTNVVNDSEYKDLFENMEIADFLKPPRHRDNGSIPYQLHLEEMDLILENQGKYYPFLLENKDKIESLVSFRIPYYVGPMNVSGPNADLQNHWMVKKQNSDGKKIYPWNWEEIVDKDKTAEAFMNNLTGTCSYLYGEPTLPASSLLYEEYCLLNELNGVRIYCKDDEKAHSLSIETQHLAVEKIFKMRKKVTKKAFMRLLHEKCNTPEVVEIRGLQKEGEFASQLATYNDYIHMGIPAEYLEPENAHYEQLEEITLWNAIFEDRSIFKEKLEKKYGPQGTHPFLDEKQIEKCVNKRYKGWGRLSKKLLNGLSIDINGASYTIIDIMRDGVPGSNYIFTINSLILSDKNKYGKEFKRLIEQHNEKYLEANGKLSVTDLQISPALRKGVTKAARAVEEIVSIAGHDPERICLEVTRSDEEKGARTKTRKKNLQEAYKKFKKDNSELAESIMAQFKKYEKELAKERVYLYFKQAGKCLYTGEVLDITHLEQYDVDHIIPQSFVKDDSINNKALVTKEANAMKSDALVLSEEVRRKQKDFWKTLRNAGLMSIQKYERLTASSITDREKSYFIQRQLVETSQITKHVAEFLEMQYPTAEIIRIKAGISSDIRKGPEYSKTHEAILPKSRIVNDFHHAHDAYLACEIDRFLRTCYPTVSGSDVSAKDIVTSIMKQRYKDQPKDKKDTSKIPGYAPFYAYHFYKAIKDPGKSVSHTTGEVFDHSGWNGPAEIESLKKVFSYKQCFIVRSPEETSGAFWKQTVYSPRSGSDKLIKLKGNLYDDVDKCHSKKSKDRLVLDADVYGGYKYGKTSYAFFTLWSGVKEEKRDIFLTGIPIAVKDNPRKYILQQANEYNDIHIIRGKVLKNQLVEYKNVRYIITGKKECRIFAEYMPEYQVVSAIARLQDGELNAENISLAAQAFSFASNSSDEHLALLADKFTSLCIDDIAIDACSKALLESLNYVNARLRTVDLAIFAEGKNWGVTSIHTDKVKNKISDDKEEVYFVDQSVTGMFERKTRVRI